MRKQNDEHYVIENWGRETQVEREDIIMLIDNIIIDKIDEWKVDQELQPEFAANCYREAYDLLLTELDNRIEEEL